MLRTFVVGREAAAGVEVAFANVSVVELRLRLVRGRAISNKPVVNHRVAC